MSLDDCMITCFCLIDELIPSVTKGKRLREREPQPKLADSEVITIEVVGSYLGFPQDKALLPTSNSITGTFFQLLRWLIARRLYAKQATCGRSKNASGVGYVTK